MKSHEEAFIEYAHKGYGTPSALAEAITAKYGADAQVIMAMLRRHAEAQRLWPPNPAQVITPIHIK